MLSAYIAAEAAESRSVEFPHWSFDNGFRRSHTGGDFIFSLPPVVTELKAPSETKIAEMAALGFRRGNVGRYTFFQGPSDTDTLIKVIKQGGDMYSYAPQERTSIAGNFAAHIIRRLLHTTMELAPKVCSSADELDFDSKFKLTPTPVATTIRPTTITTKGHFMPYFHGLLLPDNGIISNFISIFSLSLGATPEVRAQTTLLLSRGWTSLHNTSAGRVISHMIAALQLAIDGGLVYQPCFFKGDYVGTLLLGDSPIIVGANTHQAVTPEELRDSVSSVFGHQHALDEIIDIAQRHPLRKGLSKGEIRDIAEHEVETARGLHYALIDRKIPLADQNKIHLIIPKLRYKEVIFAALDPERLLVTLETITNRKERHDPRIPFDLSQKFAIFSDDRYLSALAAYGPVAPSPLPEHTGDRQAKVQDGMLRTSANGQLPGFPIYARPLQQAMEDWRTLATTGSISFSAKGKDKNGIIKLRNVGRFINPEHGPEESQAFKLLLKFKGKKREREDMEVSEKTVEENRKAKKVSKTKVDADVSATLLALGVGFADEENTAMET